MAAAATERYQPYVEDYNSEIGEVVPLSARRPANRKSNLAESSTYNDVSDSGYSSHTPATDSSSPEPKPATPAPARKYSKDQDQPTIPRPSSKAFNRTSSAVPRNIPGARPKRRESREGSPSTTVTGGADECDCPDCGSKPKDSPSSPSILTGAWPLPSPGSYGHSPYAPPPPHWPGYQHPMRYDGYAHGTPPDGDFNRSSSVKPQRSSLPPPPRPQSTFSGSAISSSVSGASAWSQGYGGSSYFGTAPIHAAPSPVPGPPTPSSTCPPAYASMYPPPPVVGSAPSPAFSSSPYAPPSSFSYQYSSDPWGRAATSGEYTPPPSASLSKRRNSVRAQGHATAAHHDGPEDAPPASTHHSSRRLSRASGERPAIWAGSHLVDGANRSYSVPPEHSGSEPRRRVSVTQPVRRRESGASGGQRLPPSSLSRAMESCAITDDLPPARTSSRAHVHHYEVARREPGIVTSRHHDGLENGGSSHSDRERRVKDIYAREHDEFVSVHVPESPGSEAFTMRYPAGVPIKLQLNGGSPIVLGSKGVGEGAEWTSTYRNVQDRQRQVHQLAMEHANGGYRAHREEIEYSHRPTYGRA